MIKERSGKLNVEGVLAFVLFGIFALCILGTLLQGVRVYQNLTERGQTSYADRTAAQYLVTRIRQADTPDAVSLGTFGMVEALELTETIDGTEYITRVYCFDGYIRELFAAASHEFQPFDGECILPAEELDFTLQDGLLTVAIKDDSGRMLRVCVSLRSTGGDTP